MTDRYSIDALNAGPPPAERKYGIDALTAPPAAPIAGPPPGTHMVPRPGGQVEYVRPDKSYSGAILPFSVDAEGNASFDSNAGIVGMGKRVLTAPGDVFTGKVDPWSEEGAARAREMAGAISPAPAARRAGEMLIPGQAKAVKKPVPTSDQLKDAAADTYTNVRQMGVEYAPGPVKELAGTIQRNLDEDGLLAELSPQTHSILNKLQADTPDDAAVTVTIASLDSARKALNRVAQQASSPNGNKNEKLAATRAIERLDEWLSRPREEDVVSGPAAAAGAKLEEARGNYAAAMRSDRVADAEFRGELNAATANSGQNVDNALRQRIKSLLIDKKATRGFSEEELTLMEKIARGTATTNNLRRFATILGGGGGLGATVSGSVGGAAGAAATGSPWGMAVGAVPPLAGAAMREGANQLTQRQVEKLGETVRMRSPLYEKSRAQPTTPPRSGALLRLYLIDQLSRDPQGDQ